MAKKPKEEPKKKESEFKLDFSESGESADYADVVQITYKDRAFLFTFAQDLPDKKEKKCISRIILSPETTGELVSLLLNLIVSYMKDHPDKKILPPTIHLELEPKKEKKH